MKTNAHPESQCVGIEISSRKQYLEVLAKIQKRTQKIIIVQIDGPVKRDPIVNTALRLLGLEKKEIVHRWYGTIAKGSRGAVQYTFDVLKNRSGFFGFLASLNSFWDGIERAADGCDPQAQFDDIAFLDSQGRLLFFSTTHEGEFNISKDLV